MVLARPCPSDFRSRSFDVATVTSTFGTTYSRGPDRKPRTYAAPITRTDRVQDNMVSFDVARSAEDAFPDKMVWRDADGKVIRVVRERR